MSQPDLFVVCKNCGSEVSPYVTECPYCGQRVRKRAPKLERGEEEEGRRRSQRRRARAPRLGSGDVEGIPPDRMPWATAALIVASLLVTLAFSADQSLDLGAVTVGVEDEPWRWLTAPFAYHDALGYQFVALTAAGIFGMLLERRFGLVFAVATFLLSGAAGIGLALALDATPALGANGAALGLLCAWYVDDRLAARRGDDRENDLLGVYVFAAVLVLLSVAEPDASIAAAVGGALAGAACGLLLTLVRR